MVSLNPTFGGSNPGLRAELIHSVKENLNLICGYSLATHPSTYASISVSHFHPTAHQLAIGAFAASVPSNSQV